MPKEFYYVFKQTHKLYISSVNIQVSEHFYVSRKVDKIFLMCKFSNTTVCFNLFFVRSLNLY